MSKPVVFISYSHKDEKWKDRLTNHLRVLDAIAVWDDRGIRAGEAWETHIQAAIATADAAILLISDHFLNSEFIKSRKLPWLLQRKREGMKLIPVIVTDCAWQAKEWLDSIQCRPTDGKPVELFPDNEPRPVYSPSARNHAHLALLVDRRGSMTPFHALTRDFVETAERAAREEAIGRLRVLYFQNVADDNLYDDPKLARLARDKDDKPLNSPLTLEDALKPCTRDSAILILSDAGAARGSRHQGRVAATEAMLARLARLTPHVAWLNPMPRTRWPGTSARLIALSVPMFEMNRLGFYAAIKTLRGQAF